MKSISYSILFSFLAFALLPVFFTKLHAVALFVLPNEDNAVSPESHELLWETVPGTMYTLESSGDLSPNSWQALSGFPVAAESLSQSHFISQHSIGSTFYRVGFQDTLAPAVIKVSPADQSFAVNRLATIEIQLYDLGGIDPESIELTVGDLGIFTLSDPELSFVGDVLVFNNGTEEALGDYEDLIETVLSVSDLAGNTLLHRFEFELEVQAEVVSNVFVFGSANAQRAGQQIGEIPTRLLTSDTPISMDPSSSPWEIESIGNDRITIAYEDTPPSFETDTFVANATPESINDIFYRNITEVIEDGAKKQLTLMTEDASLEDMVLNGTMALTDDSMLLGTDENGLIENVGESEILNLQKLTIGLDDLKIGVKENGYSLSFANVSINDGEGASVFELSAKEFNISITPNIEHALHIEDRKLKRFVGIVRGEIERNTVYGIKGFTDSVGFEHEFQVFPKFRRTFYLGNILLIPVFLTFEWELKLSLSSTGVILVVAEAGLRKTTDFELGLRYENEAIETVNESEVIFRELIREVPSLEGEINAKIGLRPSASLVVNHLAGVEVAIDRFLEATAFVNADTGFVGTYQTGIDAIIKPVVLGDFVNVALTLPIKRGPTEVWFPEQDEFRFVQHPEDVVEKEGSSATFRAMTSMDEGVTYTWFFNDKAISNSIESNAGPTLTIQNLAAGHEGVYHVEAVHDESRIVSEPAELWLSSNKPSRSIHRIITIGFDSVAKPQIDYSVSDYVDATYRNSSEFNFASDDYQIDSLSGIQLLNSDTTLFPNSLNFANQSIRTTEPLSGMAIAQKVSLLNNPIQIVSLRDMPNLEEILINSELVELVEIDNLPALEHLNLNGKFPTATINQMDVLTSLTLLSPALESVSFSGMPALTELCLSGGAFSDLSLPYLPSLQDLKLDNNLLTQLTLNSQPLLETLDVQNNPLSSLIVASTALESVELPLLGVREIKLNTLNTSNAKPLDLKSNEIETFHIDNLVSSFGILGAEAGFSMSSLAHFRVENDATLKSLKLGGPLLAQLSLNALSLNEVLLTNLPNLEYMQLGSVENVASFQFDQIPNLKTIDLTTNYAQSKAFVDGLLDYTETLSPAPAFRDLDIENGNISLLRRITESGETTHLEFINAGLITVPVLQLQKLERLNASDNDFSFIPDLSELSELEVLSLSGNKLSNLSSASGLSLNAKLTSLDLSGNQITDLTGLSGLSQITSLTLSDNKIKDVSELGLMNNLEEVFLFQNRVADIRPLLDIDNLKLLFISNNAIDFTDIEQLNVITQLEARGVFVSYDAQHSINDFFLDRILLSGSSGTASIDTTNNNHEADEPGHDDNLSSAWWSWTAPADGSLSISITEALTALGFDFTGQINLYKDSTPETEPSLDELELAGSVIGLNSASFNVTNGTDYFIQASASTSFVEGTISFGYTFEEIAINDLFADRHMLSGNMGSASSNNDETGVEPNEPNHGNNSAGKSLWWEWTASADGTFVANTFGSDASTVMAAYTGDSLDALTEITSNTFVAGPSNDAFQSKIGFSVHAGQTYYIAIDSQFNPVNPFTGAVSLNYQFHPIDSNAYPSPANDHFANAILIPGTGGIVNATNRGSGAENNEPEPPRGAAPINTVWFKWTAAQEGSVIIRTAGSDFDTILSVFEGESINALTFYVDNDDASQNDTTSEGVFYTLVGQTYYIAVDGHTDLTGNIVLEVDTNPF